ncbi:hypothetical protein RRF89_28920, partial [Escherichia coli]|uniref:hypothetical protein n=1 Tax=Escherichia coli TaxID=562 RepID=UPI0028D94EF6
VCTIAKMDSACALVTFGQGIAPVSRVLGVSRAQLTLRMKASDVTNGAIVIHTQRLKSDPGGNLLS